MRSAVKTPMMLVGLAALVLGIGYLFTGLPAPAKNLPTGLVPHFNGYGRNVLGDPADMWTRANTWAREDTTAGKPVVLPHKGAVEVAYIGEPRDTGPRRKIEVFQATSHGVTSGQRWIFSIRMRGMIIKSYADVGMEWFNAKWKWMGEKDVYPPITGSYQRFAVSIVLPANARHLAVYVQLPEINSATRIDVIASSASLTRV
jgi:hypothetical protein